MEPWTSKDVYVHVCAFLPMNLLAQSQVQDQTLGALSQVVLHCHKCPVGYVPAPAHLGEKQVHSCTAVCNASALLFSLQQPKFGYSILTLLTLGTLIGGLPRSFHCYVNRLDEII
jgi:hypothetical protein